MQSVDLFLVSKAFRLQRVVSGRAGGRYWENECYKR